MTLDYNDTKEGMKMKKILFMISFAVCLIIFTSYYSFAQEIRDRTELGPENRLSLKLSMLPKTSLGDAWTDQGHKLKDGLGASFGLSYSFPIRHNIWIQPEILLTIKEAMYDGIYFDEAMAIRLTYLEFPILIKFNIYRDETDMFRFNAFCGGRFSYLTAKDSDSNFQDIVVDISDKDYGAVLGFEAEVVFGAKRNFGIIMDARYDHGLASIANNYDLQTKAYYVSVGMSFYH